MLIRSKPFVRPLIVLVGRTNVGKSTLYNRLTQRGQSIVSAIPATTRDILFGTCHWQGRLATIVDTGGLSYAPNTTSHFKRARERERIADPFLSAVQTKVLDVIAIADHVCLVVDAMEGLTAADQQWAQYLKGRTIPLTAIVNKADRLSARYNAAEFTKLGIPNCFAVSGTNGSGLGDLLDHLLNAPTESIDDQQAPSVAIVGKPNVGKSTLYNALIGRDESIVSPLPHTTREPHRRRALFDEWEVDIIDTVGLRKKSKQEFHLEKIGAQKTLATLTTAHVVLLVIDPFDEGISNQDQDLGRMIQERNLATIIVVNKSDHRHAALHPSTIEQKIRRLFPHLSFAPLLLISAQEKKGIGALANMIKRVHANYTRTVDDETLGNILSSLVLFPSASKQKRPSGIRLKAVGANPPEFLLMQRKKTKTPIAIINIIETRLRQQLDLLGTPIKIHVRRPVGSHRHERGQE
ncbi:ribosome biogenesis GTPase Der [Candidatus Uhrbacteria bacterium]|nr:ribosome biogenesis GTPase Der [Candidatus Uhrbacteria bacterium]